MDKRRPGPPQDQPTILLIEDESTRGVALSEALQDAGFAVAQAGDVQDGLAKARAGVPDLIVVDLSPEASAGRELDLLRYDPLTRGMPLIRIRWADPGAHPGHAGDVDTLLLSPADLDILLEHVWRVVNTRVLGALNERLRADRSISSWAPPFLSGGSRLSPPRR